MLMLPLQPRSNAATANRRWVRQDFRMRRKMFLEEVSDRPSETPSSCVAALRGLSFSAR